MARVYFSEHFNIADPESHEWFDPLLHTDTLLFIDPFLIFKDAEWTDAHAEIVQYFRDAFELLAGHQDNPASLQYRRTETLMTFPEPREFGLGYVGRGTSGSGTGREFARRIVRSMSTAIERGLSNMHHFEELGVLVDKIHRDRISDITCNILKPRFIRYTQLQAEALELPMTTISVPRSHFDVERRRWVDSDHLLPLNPVSGGAVLLTPKRFLDELPKLNAVDWYNYAEPRLRDDINLDLATNLRKEDIIALARHHPELVREWTTAREADAADPYDVDQDPVGLHRWRRITRNVAKESPLEIGTPETPEALHNFVGLVIEKFKHRVEEQGMWALLYNDDTRKPKRELSVQLLFKGVVESYCEAYGVRLDREVELGRGPVDFILSTGPAQRILLEIKKMNNGKFWNGLEHQLTSYMRSDECDHGWYMAVRYNNKPSQVERTEALQRRTLEAARETGFHLMAEWIDARPKDSASNLPSDDENIREMADDDEFDGDQ